MKKIIIIILTCSVFFLATAFANFNLPTDKNYPGGIAVVKLKKQDQTEPKVYYNNHRVLARVLVQKNNNYWYAIVGIPLSAKSGTKNIIIKNNASHTYQQNFYVKSRTYPLKHITIKDKSKVTPDPELAKKIEQQATDAQTLANTWTNVKNVSTDFIVPSKGWFSSYFGIRRIYNKTKNGRHTGLDIAAVTGTPIYAAGAGTILAVKDFVLTGNTVYINHGQGLITVYAHMNKTDVKPGEAVKQGQLLGEIGATGRVTGAHLHWEVILNGAKVNPTLFLSTVNDKSS